MQSSQLGCHAGKRECTHQLLVGHTSYYTIPCAWLDFQEAFDSLEQTLDLDMAYKTKYRRYFTGPDIVDITQRSVGVDDSLSELVRAACD